MTGSRFAIFLITVLSIWGVMHAYVFWRLASLPWVANHCSRRVLVTVAVVLWASYPLGRMLDSWNLQAIAWPIEYVGANWIGLLFLLFCALLFTDVVTLGGWLVPRFALKVRSVAVMVAAGLALIALVQALRPPVVRDYEVRLPGLPKERDGLVLVQLSDLHLGTLLGRRWMAGMVERVNQMRPDLVVIVGDLVDGNVGRVEPLQPVLERLRAPQGVWAVTGNHEYYAGADRSVRLFEEAGYSVLRDRSAQVVPGLVIAGVDDLTVKQQYGGSQDKSMEKALTQRPPGATILLSHTPWQAEQAAMAGVDLMLSGHTHNGQIWPFSYLVARRYPLLGGRYQVRDMTVIVCRGTGTWGPRMRLWWPSEIVRIKLRAGDDPR
ncbi:MAG TPA: metallophosphoesterase [Clostridia bacterium]|nr:metallophosphoesterase [Clostridia bacterium]